MAVGGTNRVTQTVGFNVDKSGLNQLTQELQKIQRMSIKQAFDIDPSQNQNVEKFKKELQDAQNAAKILQNTLEKSFDVDLNAVNVSKFSAELKKLNIRDIQTQLSKIGPTGQQAFRNVTAGVFTTNTELKKTAKWIDEISTSMANTVRWGITSGIWNNLTGAVSKAYSYVKRLDTSLNDIRIVTNKSAEDMEQFAVNANKAAKDLKAGTVAYTNASLIYYQQGLSDEEVAARTETTIKTANVTGQSASTVSELLTSVWNGYKVTADEAEMYVDKLAAVAANTGADLNELSVGMSKVASAANLMGVDMDQLNAQLATIVTVTRQAPESVGTALKTIFARMGDIEAGLDSETSLGTYTKQMAQLGFNVLDMNGRLRDQGEVIEEIGNKWGSLTREQQVALSQIMAGTRQYNNLLALFDNWGMYTEALKTSENSLGTLQKQQDIYAEKTEAHLQRLTTSAETLYNQLFDKEIVNNFIDFASGALDEISEFIDAIGGGENALLLLGTIATDVFHGKIVSGIADVVGKFKEISVEARRSAAEASILTQFQNADISDEQTQNLISLEEKKLKYENVLSEADKKRLNDLIKQTGEYYKQANLLEEQTKLIDNLAGDQQESVSLYHDPKDIATLKEAIKDKTKDINALKEDIQQFEKGDTTTLLSEDEQEEKQAIQRQIEEMQKNLEQKEKELEITKSKKREEIMATSSWSMDEGDDENLFDNDLEIQEIDKNIESLSDSIKELQEQIDDIDSITENAEISTERIIEVLQKNLSQINSETAVEIEKTIEAYQDSAVSSADKDEYQKIIQEQYKQLPKYMESAQKEALAALNKYAKNLEKITDANAARLLATHQMEADLRLTDIIDRVTSATEGLSKLTVAVNSVGQLGATIADEQLSGWDKVKAILESTSASVGSFVSGITKIGEVFGKDASVFDVVKAKMAAVTAAKENDLAKNAQIIAMNKISTEAEQQEIATLASSAEVRAIVASEKSREEQITEIMNLTTSASGKIYEEEAVAILATAEAEQADTVAKRANKTATDALNASMLASPLTWIAAVIAGVVAALNALYQAHKKNIEAQKEANKEWTKSKMALVKERESLEDVASAWKELNEQYRAGQITKLELMQASTDLIQKNQDENFSILQLSSSYEELKKQMEGYAQAQRDENRKTYNEAANALTKDIKFNTVATSGADIIDGSMFRSGIDSIRAAGDSVDAWKDILAGIGFTPVAVPHFTKNLYYANRAEAYEYNTAGKIDPETRQSWNELAKELENTTSIWLEAGISSSDENVGKEIAANIPNAVAKEINDNGFILQFDQDVFNGNNPFASLLRQEEIYQYLNENQKRLAADTGETSAALLDLREKLEEEAEAREELIEKYRAEFIPTEVYGKQMQLEKEGAEFTYKVYKDLYDDIKAVFGVSELTGSDRTQFQENVAYSFGDRGYAANQISNLIDNFQYEDTEALERDVYENLKDKEDIKTSTKAQLEKLISDAKDRGEGSIQIDGKTYAFDAFHRGVDTSTAAEDIQNKMGESTKADFVQKANQEEFEKEKAKLLNENEDTQVHIIEGYQNVVNALEEQFITIPQKGFTAITQFGIDLSRETAEKLDAISDGLGHDILENNIKTAAEIGKIWGASEKTSELASATKDLGSGKELSEGQNALLKDYEEKYTQLKNITDKDSEEYIRTLEGVVQKEEEANQEALEVALNNARKNLDEMASNMRAYADDENGSLLAAYTEQYQTVLEMQSQLTPQMVTTDALTDADAVVRKIQNLGTALKSIQDGFTVNKEDLDSLLTIFPELAYQAEVTSDGILHLNQEVVESILGAQAEELDGAKELALFKINQQIAELEAEIEQNSKHIELVKAGKISEEKMMNIINEEKIANAKQEVDITATAQKTQMENNSALCKSIVEDWAQAQEAVYAYGDAVLDPTQRKAPIQYEVNKRTTSTEAIKNNVTVETNYTKEDLQKITLEQLENNQNDLMEQLASLQRAKAAIFGATAEAQEATLGDAAKLNDLLDDQIDRYHDINVQLQLITNQIERLAAAESKLVGNSLIKNLQEQNKLLDEQIEKELQKQEIRYDEARELKGQLKGFGVEFADDTITNYQAILQQYQDTYNSLARSGADEGYLDAAQKNYETLQEYIERYEELVLNEIPDSYNEVMNMYFEQIERGIEIENTKLNIELDVKQAIRDLNEFVEDSFNKLKYWGKDITTMLNPVEHANDAAIRLRQNFDSLQTDEGAGSLNLNAANLETIIEEANKALANQASRQTIAKDDGSFVVDQESMLQELQDSISAVTDNMDELAETAVKAHETWQDYFDTFNDALDAIQDSQDDLDKRINHANRMSELMYGADNYAQMSKFNRNQIEANQSRLGTLQQMQDTLQTIYDNIEDKTTEEAEKTFDRIREIEDEKWSLEEETIEKIQEQMLNAIDEVFSPLYNRGAEQEWDISQQNEEGKLDATNKEVELEIFDDRIAEALQTATPKAQAALKKFQDTELKFLKEKDKLTQYDLERAQARYELLLKQIALEDAQNNKTKMRLRRDAQGNYSYQYVADEADVDEKEQEYRKAQLDVYNKDKEYYIEQLNKPNEILEYYQEQIKDAMTRYNTAATDEERSQAQSELSRIQDLMRQSLSDWWTEDWGTAKDYLTQSFGESWAGTSAADFLAKNKIDLSDFEALGITEDISNLNAQELIDSITSTNEGAALLLDNITNSNGQLRNVVDLLAGPEGIDAAITNIFNQVQLSLNEADIQTQMALDTTKENLGEVRDGIADISDLTAVWEEQTDNLNTSMQEVLNAMTEVFQLFDTEIESIPMLDRLKELVTTATNLKNTINTVIQQAEIAQQKIGDVAANRSKIAVGSSSGDGGGTTSTITTGLDLESLQTKLDFYDWAKAMAGNLTDYAMNGTQEGRLQPQRLIAAEISSLLDNGSLSEEFVKKRMRSYEQVGWSVQELENVLKTRYEEDLQAGFSKYLANVSPNKYKEIKGFDTGGYTGAWGKSGKIAMLHEKELVLNAKDTENMLEAVSAIRDMQAPAFSISDTIVAAIAAGLERTFASIVGAPNISSIDSSKNFQQTVTINADFPNVTNQSEIEAALRNLTSVAAQRTFTTLR